MRSITSQDRDSWTGRNAEQNARLIRDMPIVPMDDGEPAWVRYARLTATGLGIILFFYAAGVAVMS